MNKKRYTILIFIAILVIISISLLYKREEEEIIDKKKSDDIEIEDILRDKTEEEAEPLYNLFIDSDPQGVELYIHSYDEPIVTPEIVEIPSGEYRIWFYPENFQPFEKRIKIEDEDKEIFISL